MHEGVRARLTVLPASKPAAEIKHQTYQQTKLKIVARVPRTHHPPNPPATPRTPPSHTRPPPIVLKNYSEPGAMPSDLHRAVCWLFVAAITGYGSLGYLRMHHSLIEARAENIRLNIELQTLRAASSAIPASSSNQRAANRELLDADDVKQEVQTLRAATRAIPTPSASNQRAANRELVDDHLSQPTFDRTGPDFDRWWVSRLRQDADRMREQCLVFGKWRDAPPAPEGMPCHAVDTSEPQRLFALPGQNVSSEASLRDFESLASVSVHFSDLFLLGSGPLPALSEYLTLLKAVRPSIYILQIGANAAGTGELNEWVRPVLLQNPEFSATVVEPVFFLFELLRRNYQPLSSRVETLSYAVAARNGPCKMMATSVTGHYKQVSTIAVDEAQGTRCFSPGRPCGFVRRMIDEGELKPVDVQCVTLDALVTRSRRPNMSLPIDILVIDAEMMDYTVLRSTNMRSLNLRPLAIEFVSRTMTAQQGHEITALLAVQGYLCRFAPPGKGAWPNATWWRPGLTTKRSETVCYRVV